MTAVLVAAGAIAAAPLLAWAVTPVMVAFELGVLYERIRARRGTS